MTVLAPTSLAKTDYDLRCELLGLEAVPCSPLERVKRLPAWLTRELISTTGAREKLHDWATRTPKPWDAPPDPAQVFVALHCYGDPTIPHLLARLLCELPPPVRDHALRSVTFLTVGCTYAGWCGPPPDYAERPWFIVVRAETGHPAELRIVDGLRFLIAHEVAHSWLLDEHPPGTRLRDALWHQTIFDSPAVCVPADALEAVMAERYEARRDERLCEALTRSWGLDASARRARDREDFHL